MEGSKKIHFHSFDAFRFFAFFKVFIFHLPLFAVTADVSFKAFFYDHIKHGGGVGVSFFFVLSGFLITYILTHEKLKTGRINLRRFFVRRAFRIWPLFYLIVIMALLIPPDIAQSIGFHTNGGGYDPDWRFSLTFTENYKSIIMGAGPKTTPLSVFWSLCIEEHFYILWMLVFFFIRRKWIPYFLVFSVFFAIFMRVFSMDIYNTAEISNGDLFTNLDYFSISGLLGYFVATNYQKISNFVSRINLGYRVIYILLILTFLYFQKDLFVNDLWFLKIFKHTFVAIMFTGLLLVFIPKNSPLRFSETNVFTRLGKISYGLYVYHLIWIHVLIKICKNYDVVIDTWTEMISFGLITLVATIGLSILSYHLFEMPILKLRERFFSNK
ncbi:MAG: acyltransferase family protein [Crocinitomix sp.]|nr:acyltransferase family protein [Crocinitomix sp.]